MANFDLMRELALPSERRIVLLVMDGLGGLPRESDGKTELEAAHTPNLDRLARQGISGLSSPIGYGITPGSGPAHLALFGYDPIQYDVGRGVLSALGIGFDLQADDVAARGNFCTVDDQGVITDRRAGRIPSEKGAELCRLLDEIEGEGVETFVRPVKEYRFVLVLRGQGLSPCLLDTDPQQVGRSPLPVTVTVPEAERTARFQCLMVYMRHGADPTPMIFQGTWEGIITFAAQGENGFGYDPVFFVPTHNCTSAELPAETKNQLSHRGQALRALVAALGHK